MWNLRVYPPLLSYATSVQVNLYFYAILHTIPEYIFSVYHRCFLYRIFITFFFKTHIYHMLFYTKCILKLAMMRFGNSNSDILKILSLISLFILHCLVLVFANIFNCGSTSAHRLAELCRTPTHAVLPPQSTNILIHSQISQDLTNPRMYQSQKHNLKK